MKKLIEVLFNSVPVTQSGKVIPFMYLIEVEDEDDGDEDEDGDGERGSYGANGAATVHEDQVPDVARWMARQTTMDRFYTDSPNECG